MDIGHLGDSEQPSQVGHLDWDPVLLEGVVDERDVLVLAEEHRHVPPGDPFVVERPHDRCDRLSLSDGVF